LVLLETIVLRHVHRLSSSEVSSFASVDMHYLPAAYDDYTGRHSSERFRGIKDLQVAT
jgi:hypothetical protein